MILIERTYDPLKEYAGNTEARLDEACGLIPMFLKNDEEPIKDNLEAGYGFGNLIEMTGGNVEKNGMYYYPEDPPLAPYIKFVKAGETLYIYPYGIVAIVDASNTFVSRMD